MVNDKMCVGVESGQLMARVGPDAYEKSLSEPGCKEMKFTGRPLKGFVYVEAAAIDSDATLRKWVKRCLDYNPDAPSSKKPRKKK